MVRRTNTNNRRVIIQDGEGFGDFLKKGAMIGKRALNSNVGKQLQGVARNALNQLIQAGVARGEAELNKGVGRLTQKISGNGLALAGGKYKKRATVSRQYRAKGKGKKCSCK